MSDLPDGWVDTTIGEVVVPKVEQRTPSADEDFIYIHISSVDRVTKKIVNPQKLSGKDAPSRARQVVANGDVLVSMTRPNLNAVAMVSKELDGQIASTGFDVLRAKNVESRWLYYLVRTNDFVTAMSDLVQGALYPAVRPRDIRNFEIPLAPLSEQKRIAEKLDTLLAHVDACQTHLERVPQILKRFRQSVLAAATSGRLTEDWRESHQNIGLAKQQFDEILTDREKRSKKTPEKHLLDEEFDIPKGWLWVSLDSLSSQIVDGTHFTPTYVDEGVPFISVKDIRNGRIDFSDTKFIPKHEHLELSKRCKPEIGDLLITKSGTIGRMAMVNTDTEFSLFVSVALLKPASQLVNMRFIEIGLESWINSIDISSRIVCSTIKNLHIRDMRV